MSGENGESPVKTEGPQNNATYGKFWRLFPSESDQKLANTSRRFASRERVQLNQVECSLSGVTQNVHAQQRKLKLLQAQLAAVVATLDTLVVSQSVSQQLLAEARAEKLQRLRRRYGQATVSTHVKHARGVLTPDAQASMHASELIEDLMHAVAQELTRVRDMDWQQCMEYEWGVRVLVAPKEVSQQRMAGMRVAKWGSKASRFVKNLFRGKIGMASGSKIESVDSILDSGGRRFQNVPKKLPVADMSSERCRTWERSHMLRLGGMSRQHG